MGQWMPSPIDRSTSDLHRHGAASLACGCRGHANGLRRQVVQIIAQGNIIQARAIKTLKLDPGITWTLLLSLRALLGLCHW
mmetsp:Transcript_57905/g.95906  ORF Transcript_57905/g.95906 Transcript_57905/m.95906 type:complete len:81 (-) Transcript_57905:583-825(-)